MDSITDIKEAMDREQENITSADATTEDPKAPAAAPVLVVDDGTITVPIRNKQGQPVGKFVFSPTDIHMLDRYNEIAADFEKIVEPLEHININPDGSTDEGDDAAMAAMGEATQRLYDACDYLFGGNMSEAFFGKVHPFSPVDGRFYCENVLEAVGGFIAKQFNRSTQKLSRRASEYLHGANTRTGKHRYGKQ